jgi:hypothetical protein
MNDSRKARRPSIGWLVFALVLTLAVVPLPPLRRISRLGDTETHFVIWVTFIVPWATWIWLSLRYRESLKRYSAGIGFWIRCAVWAATAALVSALITDTYNQRQQSHKEAETRLIRESEPGYSQRFQIAYEYFEVHERLTRNLLADADIQRIQKASEEADARIAERYHIAPEQVRRIGESAIFPVTLPTTPVDVTPIALLFDGLLILNMPLYWLLSLVFFGRSRSMAELLSDAFATSDAWFSDPFRARMLFMLSALAAVAELYWLEGLI